MNERGADDLGELVGSGRSADLYDLGDGTLLRRTRDGDVAAHEIIAMRLAERAGYAVPHVSSVEGPDMVLAGIEGQSMLDILSSRPWRAARYGRLLGELAVRLRAIAPDDADLRGSEPREALVHGDLHPGNVLMSAGGPVVIDWESARAGPADFDAGTTWLLIDSADVDDVPTLIRPILTLIRARFIRSFLYRTGHPRSETIDQVCKIRLADPNMRPAERERIRRFRSRHGSGGCESIPGEPNESPRWRRAYRQSRAEH